MNAHQSQGGDPGPQQQQQQVPALQVPPNSGAPQPQGTNSGPNSARPPLVKSNSGNNLSLTSPNVDSQNASTVFNFNPPQSGLAQFPPQHMPMRQQQQYQGQGQQQQYTHAPYQNLQTFQQQPMHQQQQQQPQYHLQPQQQVLVSSSPPPGGVTGSPVISGGQLYMNHYNVSGQSRHSLFHEKPTVEVVCHILETRWAPRQEPGQPATEDASVVARFVPRGGSSRSGSSSSTSNAPPTPQDMEKPFSLFAFRSMFRVKGEQVGPEVPVDWSDFGCVYHCTTQAQIPLNAYVERIVKYFKCAPQCFPVALALLDKFVHNTHVAVDSRNVLRLFLCAILAAAKSREEKYMTMSYYAHIGGITPFELRSLELHFLFSLKWDLHVTESRYNDIAAGISLTSVIPKGLSLIPNSSRSSARGSQHGGSQHGGSARGSPGMASPMGSSVHHLMSSVNSDASPLRIHPMNSSQGFLCSPDMSMNNSVSSMPVYGNGHPQGRQGANSPYTQFNPPHAPLPQPHGYNGGVQQQQPYSSHSQVLGIPPPGMAQQPHSHNNSYTNTPVAVQLVPHHQQGGQQHPSYPHQQHQGHKNSPRDFDPNTSTFGMSTGSHGFGDSHSTGMNRSFGTPSGTMTIQQQGYPPPPQQPQQQMQPHQHQAQQVVYQCAPTQQGPLPQ